MIGADVDEFISDFSRFYILTLLYEGPCHGYSIISRFKKRIGKGVSPSLVYPFLQQLEQKGLVKHTVRHVGEKEKKVYELTVEGKELCEHLFKRFAALISVAIEPSLEICANCGCKVYECRYREMIDGKETVFCYLFVQRNATKDMCEACAAKAQNFTKKNVSDNRTFILFRLT